MKKVLFCLLSACACMAAMADKYVSSSTGKWVDLRESPDVAAERAGILTNGMWARLLGTQGEWYVVEYDNAPSYVPKGDVEVLDESDMDEFMPSPEAVLVIPRSGNVNIRQSPSLEGVKVGTLTFDEPGWYYADKGGWYRIEGGRYVSKDLTYLVSDDLPYDRLEGMTFRYKKPDGDVELLDFANTAAGTMVTHSFTNNFGRGDAFNYMTGWGDGKTELNILLSGKVIDPTLPYEELMANSEYFPVKIFYSPERGSIFFQGNEFVP